MIKYLQALLLLCLLATALPLASQTAFTSNYGVNIQTRSERIKGSMTTATDCAGIQAEFTAEEKVCVGQQLHFINQSTADSTQRITYSWNFGDGNTSSVKNPVHTFKSYGIFPVRLKVLYENTSCISEIIKEVEVTALPQVTVLPDDEVAMCSGDTLELKLDGIFDALSWQDGSTDSTLRVTAAGSYMVTAYNAMGCSVINEVTVSEQSLPFITISLDRDHPISRGESVILTASGADRYEWEPARGLDNPNSANPAATPDITTTYTVTGYNTDYCKNTAEVTVYVTVDDMHVTPPALFSPNGDGTDDYWIIENIASYPECHFSVFNMQGSPVYQSGAAYNNDWDGRDNHGRPLSEGVYYYVFHCGGKQHEKSGSITIIR